MEEARPRKGGGAGRVLLGLLVGAAAGVIANGTFGPDHDGVRFVADKIANPVGQVFLRLLFMVVIPLVFASLVLGVAALGNLRQVGRIGGKTIAYFVLTTAAAATIGILLVNTFRPGELMDPEQAKAIQAQSQDAAAERIRQGQEGTGFGVGTFVNIVPRNVIDSAARGDMLAVIFFALMIGIACTLLPEERTKSFLAFFSGLNDVCGVLIRIAMKLAPFGVAGLIFAVTAKFGADILKALSAYVVLVLAGLAIHQFLVLGAVVKLGAGLSPFVFFRKARGLMATAFGTSSSNATLPTTIRTAVSEFGVPQRIAGFVLPLGATLNMNGTALFEGFSVLFLAQVAGVHLDLGTQVVVVVMAVLTAIGAAGVPGGSLPLLALVLERVGVPPEMLALILGVDRIVDMARTVPNVTGDLTATLVVARSEKAWSPGTREA